jgi:hypothetical protein
LKAPSWAPGEELTDLAGRARLAEEIALHFRAADRLQRSIDRASYASAVDVMFSRRKTATAFAIASGWRRSRGPSERAVDLDLVERGSCAGS